MADFLKFEVIPELQNKDIQSQIKDSMGKMGAGFKGIESKFSSTFKGMGKGLGGLLNPISGIKKAMGDSFSGAPIDGMTSSLGGLKSAALGLGVALAGIVGIKKGFNIAGDFEQEQSKLEFSMGSLSDSTKEFIKGMDAQLGLGEVAITKNVAQIALKAKGLGFVGDELAANTQNMTKMAYDMAGALNISDTQAIDAISSAMTGQTRALKQWGIVLEETDVEKYAKDMGIAKDAITETQKAQIRLNILQEKMGGIGVKGGIEGALNTFNWAMQAMQAQVADVSKNLFAPMTQALTPLIRGFAMFLQKNKDGFSDLGKTISNVFGGIVKFAQELAPLFISFGDSLGDIGSSLDFSFVTEVADFIKQLIFDITKGIADIGMFIAENSEGFAGLFNILADVFVSILPALKAVGSYLVEIGKLIFKVADIIIQVLMPVFKAIGEAIKGFAWVIEKVYGGVGGAISKITGSDEASKKVDLATMQEQSVNNKSVPEESIKELGGANKSSTINNEVNINVETKSSDPALTKDIAGAVNNVVEDYNRKKELELGVI